MQTAAVIKTVANAAADASVDKPQPEEEEVACNVAAAAASTHVELMCHGSSVSQSDFTCLTPHPSPPLPIFLSPVCLFVSLSLALFELCFQCCRAQRVAAFMHSYAPMYAPRFGACHSSLLP